MDTQKENVIEKRMTKNIYVVFRHLVNAKIDKNRKNNLIHYQLFFIMKPHTLTLTENIICYALEEKLGGSARRYLLMESDVLLESAVSKLRRVRK